MKAKPASKKRCTLCRGVVWTLIDGLCIACYYDEEVPLPPRRVIKRYCKACETYQRDVISGICERCYGIMMVRHPRPWAAPESIQSNREGAEDHAMHEASVVVRT